MNRKEQKHENEHANNVVPIHSKKFLGDYFARQNGRSPAETSFYAGVVLTVGLPHLAFFTYGGNELALASAVSVLVGYVAGLVLYHRWPYRVTSCVVAAPVTKAPPSKDKKVNHKDAA